MMIKNKIKKIIIKHPLLHTAAKKIKSKINKSVGDRPGSSINYQEWIKKTEPIIWSRISPSDHQPLISVVVPAFNTPDKYLEPLIKSLTDQTYHNWQLCIADASNDITRQRAIRKIADSDARISYSHKPNLHISDNTNEGLKLATGEFIGLLDHDDTLSPHALEEVIAVVEAHKAVDIVYSDEDKLSDNGTQRSLPFFKPDWSPDLLLGVNYITHFLVVRKSYLDQFNGLRSNYDGAQDYDLLLRLTEKTKNIVHIPKILYHWRLADGSTSKSVGEKNYADNAGQEALRDAVKRRKINADVIEIKERPTNYRLRYILPTKQPLVSIIIPFKDKPELLQQCVGGILEKTTYNNYEIILLSNNSSQLDTHALVKELKRDSHVRAYEWNHPFNYSKINNYGVSKSKGDFITLLNNDTDVITPTWLDELVAVAMQPGVGAVGPMLLYPDTKNGIQHAGVVLGMGTMAGHVFRHRQPTDWTEFGSPLWPRNYLAVTAACMMVSRKAYESVGGLDETFTVAGNDVAFCLRLYESGLRNVYWPSVVLWHHESVSVGTYHNGIQIDYDHSLMYYRRYHEAGDPYFNKNLDLMNEQIGIGA